MAVETEIKFRVTSIAALTQRLEAGGFRLQTARSFESNTLYDTPDRQLRARTEILRIRSYAGRWTLTHKRLPATGVPGDRSSSLGWATGVPGDRSSSPGSGASSGPSDPDKDRHKQRIETETEVADGDALAEVFLSLGLVAAFRYEKWRTEWQEGDGHCVIDETPIGVFAELEGPAEWIDRTAARLGVSQAEYLTLSYGRLFDLWRAEHHSHAENLTFRAVAPG
jgi:adenylate cyclase, class 2